MISELRRLLAEAGYECPAGEDIRDHLLITNNAGSIPVDPAQSKEHVGRGFQLVLLTGKGRPSHYARCRWAGDVLFAQECEHVTALSADPELDGLIPRFRTAASSTIRVLVSEYLSGGTHLDRLPRESASEWLRTATVAAHVRDRISERAHVMLPSLSVRRAGETPSRIVSERLDLLGRAGLPLQDLEALESAVAPLDSGPRPIQHGDFWPGNLVRHRSSWWVIDYEEFGTVFSPLYDIFHYLQQTARVRTWGASDEWLGEGASRMPGAWKRAFGRLLDHQIEQLGLSREEVVAALTFYVIRMGSHRLRPGVPREFAEPLLGDADTIAQWIRESGTVEDLLPWIDAW